MKKIPLHTTIFFVIALIPIMVFVIFLILGMLYGDVEEGLLHSFVSFHGVYVLI